MINRRTLLTTSAMVPFARAQAHARLDVADIRRDPMELEDGNDVQILSISPDGNVLVGLRSEEQLTFFDAETRQLISESEVRPELAAMDTTSINWSPDSTRLAFNSHLHTRREESDILIAEAISADISNATEDIVIDDSNRPADVDNWPRMAFFPLWLDDSTILFVTWGWNTEGVAVNHLMQMTPGESEISNWTDLEAADIDLIGSPPKPTSDGRLIFTAEPEGNKTRLFSARVGETPQQIDVGDTQNFTLVDANDTHAILLDIAKFVTWYLPLDDASAMTDVRTVFQFEDDEHQDSWPAFGPDPETLVIAQANKNRSILVLENGQVREIAYLRGEKTTIRALIWVGDQVLVTGDSASWLVSTEL